MKHRLLSLLPLLLALTLVLTLSACKDSPDGEEPEGTKATNDIVDYLFYYPEGWTIDSSTGMLSVYAVKDITVQTNITGADESTAFGVFLRPNVSVTAFNLPTDKYPSVESYWEESRLLYENSFDNFTLISSDKTSVAGNEALKYVYEMDIAGVKYRYMQSFFFYKQMAHTITFTCTPELFDEYTEDVQGMVDTFKFK